MDLISRQAAIDAVTKYCLKYDLRELLADIECLPTAEPNAAVLKVEVSAEEAMETVKNTLSDYFDTLWKTAYERGKAEAHPKKGEWVAFANEGGELDLRCSVCGEEQGFFFGYFNYCPNCGAKMEELA